jgi:non-ribosomal peptide synthetase component E (peptide arylation enzyme)
MKRCVPNYVIRVRAVLRGIAAVTGVLVWWQELVNTWLSFYRIPQCCMEHVNMQCMKDLNAELRAVLNSCGTTNNDKLFEQTNTGYCYNTPIRCMEICLFHWHTSLIKCASATGFCRGVSL